MPEDSDLATGDLGDEVDLNGYYAFRFKDDSLLRDLSAWRVTIPALVAKPDPDYPKRHLHSFVVDVRRVDVLEDDFEACNWTIERKYAEFYVLEQRLTEFHGDFEDALLPPKKLVGTRNQEFLESKRPAFEQYLQIGFRVKHPVCNCLSNNKSYSESQIEHEIG
ncbi:hypothetical protein CAPTEDRAFT_203562 [Capitella teleta]|uniref:PX domain-containing protein n=1 Tax=Capitella teleta TaxID=283909 RepID=R7TYK3_CAPTE|nr:hypothetical protein CAPTEDRAFT_203562 [Capitella teleta]|eukprot:ELT98993.1 hypothetical protein CAPTEDRAFT_203562 [Capitella teleta]